MAGTRRVGYRRRWIDRLGLAPLLRSFRVAFRQSWRKSATLSYPEEPFSEARWGPPRLLCDAEGRTRCVACHLCSAACPSDCIEVEEAEDAWKQERKAPRRFEIDLSRCIFCGYCALACPVGAIAMGERRSLAAGGREELVFSGERLRAG